MFVLVSSELITKLGMYVLLPIFIAFLFFIMYDISKKNNAGKQGTFWIFLAHCGESYRENKPPLAHQS